MNDDKDLIYDQLVFLTEGRTRLGEKAAANLARQCLSYSDRIDQLTRALDVYQRERDRFKATHPEIAGHYFLTGGHGEEDDNFLPQFVRICPAYGCAWEQVYEKTNKTISYEGA